MNANIVRFLADCFEVDNRQKGIRNLFAKTIKHRRFVEGGADLLSSIVTRLPINADYAHRADADVQLFRRERSLHFCVFPVVVTVLQPKY